MEVVIYTEVGKLSAILVQDSEGGYLAYLKDTPAVFVHSNTVPTVISDLNTALHTYLVASRWRKYSLCLN